MTQTVWYGYKKVNVNHRAEQKIYKQAHSAKANLHKVVKNQEYIETRDMEAEPLALQSVILAWQCSFLGSLLMWNPGSLAQNFWEGPIVSCPCMSHSIWKS